MQPLLLTRDRALVDEVARLSAAAGVRPDVYDDPLAALAAWPRAPLVLVGADLVDEVAAARPATARRGARRGLDPDGRRLPGRAGHRRRHGRGAARRARPGWSTCSPTPRRRRGAGGPSGVIGGAGGAGASTFACALGQVAAPRGPDAGRRHRPARARASTGCSVSSRCAGVRWGDLASSSGRLGARSLREAVPRSAGGLGVLTWAPGAVLEPDATVVREAVAAAQRGHDLVVLDLARHGTALVDELVARCDRLLVVRAGDPRGRRVDGPAPRPASAARPGRRWPCVGAASRGTTSSGPPACRSPSRCPSSGACSRRSTSASGPVRHHRVPLARAARQVLEEAA